MAEESASKHGHGHERAHTCATFAAPLKRVPMILPQSLPTDAPQENSSSFGTTVQPRRTPVKPPEKHEHTKHTKRAIGEGGDTEPAAAAAAAAAAQRLPIKLSDQSRALLTELRQRGGLDRALLSALALEDRLWLVRVVDERSVGRVVDDDLLVCAPVDGQTQQKTTDDLRVRGRTRGQHDTAVAIGDCVTHSRGQSRRGTGAARVSRRRRSGCSGCRRR